MPTKRHLRAISVLTAGLATVLAGALMVPSPASADTVPPSQHPTFEASYLNGSSGVSSTTSVSLAGSWGFEPVTDTTCTGGGRFGTTTGPMTCVSQPAAERRTTIQVPGGGWVKQGFTDVSVATTAATSACRTSAGPR